MDVFNKIYSQVSNSVSSTVSQLSNALPGNPVTREYETITHIASAGPGLCWKIYKGTKRSSKQPVSIFVFEKRQLEKWGKPDREIILETLRRGVIQLTKIRHPRILTVEHPLEESRESLAFATEPIFASLANILGKTFNMPQPANMSDYKLYDVEIKYGLLQVAEGLAFLHHDVKMLHKNMSPESIIVNSEGAWKIFGFDFCVHNTNTPNSTATYPFEEYILSLPYICRSNIEYLSPECVMNKTHSSSGDMFSLGMLVHAIYSPNHTSLFSVQDIQQFKAKVDSLQYLSLNKLQFVPEALRQHVISMLNLTPENRPDAHQFIKIPYFDDLQIKILLQLDSILHWNDLQKSQFYKGLPDALPSLPQRVKVQRILYCLAKDLAQPSMVPFILPSMLSIAEDCNQHEYTTYILPSLKPVMKMNEPIQVLLILMQHMELLLKLTPPEDVQQHVLPMLYRGLDSDNSQVHELCLTVLPSIIGLLEHGHVKNSLLPRIKKLCLSTSTLSVRVNCLFCISRLLEHLDKWLVLDDVLPFLPQIPSREPAVLMGILGIYKLALTHKKLGISKEIIATRILPFLMPLCIENGLTINQFNTLVQLVKEMFQSVETEHRVKLEQLNSFKDEQRVLTATMPCAPSKTIPELETNFTVNSFSLSTTNKEEHPNMMTAPTSNMSFQNQTASQCQESANYTSLINDLSITKNLYQDPKSPPIQAYMSANKINRPMVNNFGPSLPSITPNFKNQSPANVSGPQQNYFSNILKPATTSNVSSNFNPNFNTFPTLTNLVSPHPLHKSQVQAQLPISNMGNTNNNKNTWNSFDNFQTFPNYNTSLLQPTTTNQQNANSNNLRNNNTALSKDEIMDLLS